MRMETSSWLLTHRSNNLDFALWTVEISVSRDEVCSEWQSLEL